MREHRIDGVGGTEEIDIKQAAGVGFGCFLDSAKETDPGIVDQDVDLAEVRFCSVNNLFGTDPDR